MTHERRSLTDVDGENTSGGAEGQKYEVKVLDETDRRSRTKRVVSLNGRDPRLNRSDHGNLFSGGGVEVI